MKKQIARLSPHQNAKVFAVLMAVSSMVFVVPFFLIFSAAAPPGQPGPPTIMFFLMPIFYLVFGHIFVALGCLIYNFLFKFVGGFEFESAASDSESVVPGVPGTRT